MVISLDLGLYIGMYVSQYILIIMVISATISGTLSYVCILVLLKYTKFPLYIIDYIMAKYMQDLKKIIDKFQTLNVFIQGALQPSLNDVTFSIH